MTASEAWDWVTGQVEAIDDAPAWWREARHQLAEGAAIAGQRGETAVHDALRQAVLEATNYLERAETNRERLDAIRHLLGLSGALGVVVPAWAFGVALAIAATGIYLAARQSEVSALLEAVRDGTLSPEEAKQWSSKGSGSRALLLAIGGAFVWTTLLPRLRNRT